MILAVSPLFRFNSLQTGTQSTSIKGTDPIKDFVISVSIPFKRETRAQADNDEKIANVLATVFRFPSNGKADRKERIIHNGDPMDGKVSIPFKPERTSQERDTSPKKTSRRTQSFHSLQMGTHIESKVFVQPLRWYHNFNSLQTGKQSTSQAGTQMPNSGKHTCFDSLQTGTQSQSPYPETEKEIIHMFRFPSNGNAHRKPTNTDRMWLSAVLGFDSLQTGTHIESRRCQRNDEAALPVSIPFKPERTSKALESG